MVILGAWGTGVFRLDAEDVAAWFRNALAMISFGEVVFAIPDEDKLECFRETFEEPPETLDARMLGPPATEGSQGEDACSSSPCLALEAGSGVVEVDTRTEGVQ